MEDNAAADCCGIECWCSAAPMDSCLHAFVELLRSVSDGSYPRIAVDASLSSMCITSCVIVLKRYETRMGI